MSRVFFDGLDTVGRRGLWVTEGTAGTHEINVIGAAPNGVNPSNFEVLNHNEVLFQGVDAAGHQGLWVTDGTTRGTHELTGIRDANSLGIEPADITLSGTVSNHWDAIF